ncbi:Uncharacterised protein [Mycobacteroides abscessus subsp. abscessus]|nr:Uncharacterised protein [Mycobacteroides abscessus subsp. abscessus]
MVVRKISCNYRLGIAKPNVNIKIIQTCTFGLIFQII